MNQQQAERQAAKSSKTEGAQYVVWVFDEGRQICNREQARRWGPLVQIECVYVDGVRIDTEIAQKLVTL
jgi:hypothetical protein